MSRGPRRIRNITPAIEPGRIWVLTEDGLLWLGVMENETVGTGESSIMTVKWVHVPGPDDGKPGYVMEKRPAHNVVVGKNFNMEKLDEEGKPDYGNADITK